MHPHLFNPRGVNLWDQSFRIDLARGSRVIRINREVNS